MNPLKLFCITTLFATAAFSAETAKEDLESKLKHLQEQKEQLAQMMDDVAVEADISTDEKEALNEEFLKTQKELDANISNLKKVSE